MFKKGKGEPSLIKLLALSSLNEGELLFKYDVVKGAKVTREALVC
jgi:hypothetical protein